MVYSIIKPHFVVKEIILSIGPVHIKNSVLRVKAVLAQFFDIRRIEPISTSPYAASTAYHTCRIMALGPVISDVSNCPFLILFANSIPLNVTSAFPNILNPRIG